MSNIVFIENNEVVTDSLTVAGVFGKQHKDVLKAIETLKCSVDFRERNFALSEYKTEGNNKNYKKYLIKRDGVSFLVMGFTGFEAARFKEMYITEFNRMEQKLKNRNLDSFMIDDPIARAEKWIKEQQEKQLLLVQNKELSEKIIEAKPKLDMYDAWLDVDRKKN